MAKELKQTNNIVFANIVRDLALSAIAGMDNVLLPEGKGYKTAQQRSSVSVYFLSHDTVSIDLYVNINLGIVVPDAVCVVQEKVKTVVEGSTKYKVNSVNVHVLSVCQPE